MLDVPERSLDQAIVSRYARQPDRLPADLRRLIESRWHGAPVMLYAFADLDASLRLAESWLAVGPERVALARRRGTAPQTDWEVEDFPRARIADLRETPGLSANTLAILGRPGEPALALLRYSHRQRRAFESIRCFLADAAAGRESLAVDADQVYAQAVAGPVREAQALVAGNRAAVVRRLLGYLRPYRRQLTVGLTTAALVTGLSLVPPWLVGTILDGIVAPARSGRLDLDRASLLAWLALAGMASAYVLRQVAVAVRLRLTAVMGELVARDIRTELYEHLHRLSLSFYARKRTGSIITRVSSDTDRLWDFMAFGVVDVTLSLVLMLSLGAVLLALDWRLGLAMIAPVPVFCWLTYRHGQRMKTYFLRGWRKWSRVTDVLTDTIPGIRVVKAFNQEGREVRRFNERNQAVAREFSRIHEGWTSFWPLLMLGVHATTVLVWALALPRLLGGAPELSPGTFVSFLLYTAMFVGPIDVVGQMARTINRATTSAHRVFEVLDTEPDIADPPSPVRLEPVAGRVTFERVIFGYDGVRQVVKDMSFDVAPGELIGLVGPSGGGKSTVVNLIARFYDVTGGAVLIDGVDIRQLDSGHYRQQIGMVLQEPYLFHGTVLENIRYGNPDASPEAIIAAARAANAHDFITRLPHGYDTVVGERGQTLSGGERQRVSIARAILHDPRILILDEATSSVDTETERAIQDALDRLVAGRTVFAIAHRLSTLRKASRLFVIEDGTLVEHGTHAELLGRAGGRYRRLYDMQLSLS